MEDLSIENLESVLKLVEQLTDRPTGLDPNAYYAKAGVIRILKLGKNRADRIENAIKANRLEHVVSGHSIVAPGQTWYEGLRLETCSTTTNQPAKTQNQRAEKRKTS